MSKSRKAIWLIALVGAFAQLAASITLGALGAERLPSILVGAVVFGAVYGTLLLIVRPSE